ncbi:hypothetical protein PLUA15_220259 [Pseudomonas lundensis]|uniref:Uncharacterized protein n=1 Tax=Pseudomonas lundensis TaxID=86185 RepID=A0AAX2H630_9PSED|nr:hypothetical protein PLUA15_220259 [Pseudomonas lundensis]
MDIERAFYIHTVRVARALRAMGEITLRVQSGS